MVAGRLANLDAGSNQHAPIGATSKGRAAELLNVGTKSVERARAVLRDGAPELVAAVDDGKVAVSTAAAQDNTLYETAQRIHGRAIKRCGELLAQITPAPAGRHSEKQKSGAAPTPISRRSAGDDAGLSERQRKTALRVAAIPAQEFEEAIEQSPPPTVTELAERGKKPSPKVLHDLGGRAPAEGVEMKSTTAQWRRRRPTGRGWSSAGRSSRRRRRRSTGGGCRCWRTWASRNERRVGTWTSPDTWTPNRTQLHVSPICPFRPTPRRESTSASAPPTARRRQSAGARVREPTAPASSRPRDTRLSAWPLTCCS